MPQYGKCADKVRHPNEGKARAAMRSTVALRERLGRPPEAMNVYPCTYCAGWHVGHVSPNAHRNRYAK